MSSLVSAPNPATAFLGGSQSRNLQPPASSGGSVLGPANTAVSAPANGVAPTQIKQALNNSTTNIGVPLARLCQLSSRNALVAPQNTDDPNEARRMITETEDLDPFTLAFVLGLRSSAMKTNGGVAKILGGNGGNIYHGSANGLRTSTMPGLSGPDKFQQLCSLPYLQSYFSNVLCGKVIDLSQKLQEVYDAMVPSDQRAGIVGIVAAAQRGAARDGVAEQQGDPTVGANATLLDAPDLAKRMGLPGSAAGDAPENYQGIFARDMGPFLKGKGGKSALVACTRNNLPERVGTRTRQPYSVSRNMGDDYAFAMLDTLMAAEGLTDWRPDGIVLSKGVNDPSDKMSDEFLDARDGQLFNLRLQARPAKIPLARLNAQPPRHPTLVLPRVPPWAPRGRASAAWRRSRSTGCTSCSSPTVGSTNPKKKRARRKERARARRARARRSASCSSVASRARRRARPT